MDYEAQLKLQAYLDNELPEKEAREVANWLARDRDAVALQAELRNTRQSLTGFEATIRLAESREFYWSKIQREIERQEAPRPQPVRAPLMARFRRYLLPAGALAGLMVAGLMVGLHRGAEPEMETAVADTGAFTYRDYASGATLIWFSFPAENEVAQNDADDTLD